MNQQLSLAKRVSILFVCLSDEWAYELLRHMSPQGMRRLIGNLNLLKGISLYDCEAALIDVIEILLREEETRVTSTEYVIGMLRFALPDTELPSLLKEISTDRKEATQLLLLPEADRRQSLLSKHALDVLRGIRSRLLDSLDTRQLHQDHFYKELLHNMVQKIDRQPRQVARHLEAALEREQGAQSEVFPLNLSGRKKAALALLQFGEEAMIRVFKYLAPSERQALAFEMICLENLGFHEELLALMDYMELLLNLKLISADHKDEVRELVLILRNEVFLEQENTEEQEASEIQESGDVLELFASHLYDEEEAGLFAQEAPSSQLLPDEIRERLLRIGLGATESHPRLIARAVRYMFRQ